MGLATARAAALAGARVTITGSGPERLASALTGLPEGTAGAVVDVRDGSTVAALFERTGTVDHLVITAGDAPGPSPLGTTPIAQLRERFEVRFWGAVAAVQQAVDHLTARGSITLTSGTIGTRPGPASAITAASAAAVEGLVRGLAVELAPLRVNAVRPGVVRTPMWDVMPEPRRTATLDALAGRTLTGAVGTADQIAAAHLYLMDNDFVTGTVLTLDGGALLAPS